MSSDPAIQRFYDTIHERERERDEVKDERDLLLVACERALSAGERIKAQRDELQRKLDAYQKLAAPVWPKRGNTALDFESEIAYIDELDKKEKP